MCVCVCVCVCVFLLTCSPQFIGPWAMKTGRRGLRYTRAALRTKAVVASEKFLFGQIPAAPLGESFVPRFITSTSGTKREWSQSAV